LEATVGGVEGRLFVGRAGGPGLLLVPGAAPAGLADPRTNRVAVTLCRAGRTVFVPALDLYRGRLDEGDIERLVACSGGLSHALGSRISVFAISYGGSLALIAASDPRAHTHISRIGTFGAYFDLVGVIQAVTAGISIVGGRRIPWTAHPLAREFLYARTTEELVPAHERALFLDVLAGQAAPDGLSQESRSYSQLLLNTDPEQAFPLAEQLRDPYRQFLTTFSPSRVASQIRVPVLALHSIDDPVVPYGELIRLGEAMPGVETIAVGIFQHVNVHRRSAKDWLRALPDLNRLWNFTNWVLAG
jgi:pimeloyl-ACP methyl ester carboxylesterase